MVSTMNQPNRCVTALRSNIVDRSLLISQRNVSSVILSVQSVFLLLHIILRMHEQYTAMLYFQRMKIIHPIRAYAEKSERYKVLTNERAILNLRAKSGVLFPRDYFFAFFTRLQELK